LKWSKLVYFQAGEDMKASEWIVITEEPIIMRCTSKRLNFDGVVAYINNVVDYVKGEVVPVYLLEFIEEHKDYTCPTCGGSGYIEKI